MGYDDLAVRMEGGTDASASTIAGLLREYGFAILTASWSTAAEAQLLVGLERLFSQPAEVKASFAAESPSKNGLHVVR
jgi:hypothetical protein